MIWSLRRRLLLWLVPLVVLVAILGSFGLTLMFSTGGRIDAILRENYASVRAMFRLNEALERIDSSFQFALSGREEEARKQYADNWVVFDEQFRIEENNITIEPIERELVGRLSELRRIYRETGDRFFARPLASPQRVSDYFGPPGGEGLLARFRAIKTVSGEILRINQESMEQARDEAQATAHKSLIGFAVGFAFVVLLGAVAVWRVLRSIVGPIREMTAAAEEIGTGNLNRHVPILRRDELGQLAEQFNRMTAQLREYRQSNLARLFRAQKTAQATIDSFPDPVLVVDPGGRVELANAAARELLGVLPADDAGAHIWQPPESLRDPLAETLRTQRPWLTESFDQAITFRLHGEERAYLPQVRPIRDPHGDTLGAAIVLSDITRFRLLDQFKSDLVATVSHELKTPLTSLRLAVHVLLEEAVGPLNPKQTELLIDARENAERLLKMIEHLLALARLGKPEGVETFRPESPAELLQRAADNVRARAEDKHVDVVVEADGELPPIAVAPDRMALALGNLLENAVLYTPPGGKITLSAEPAADGQVTLSIADTGIGIPTEHVPHVFERFFRVPGRAEGVGTGLGLAIVKEIVNAHRGTITCASEPGQWTVFRITLPAWKGDGHER